MHKIGLLGYGYWGPVLTNCFFSIDNQFSIIADRHLQKAEEIRKKYNNIQFCSTVDEVIEDPTIEGVVIALPTSMHYEVCKKALLAGKHVLVEKPLTNSLDQAIELLNLANAAGLTLMVDHHFIYKKSVRRLKKMVDEGALGELQYYDSTRVNLGIFRKDDDVVWDLLPHDLSIAKYVLGRSPISVSAIGASHIIPGKIDVAHVNLFYDNNFMVHVNLSWLVPQKVRTIYIGGEKGVALFDDNEPVNKLKVCEVMYEHHENMGVACSKKEWRNEEDTDNALASVAQEFISCIETGNKPLSDGFFAKDIVKVIETTQKSIKLNGQRISIL